MSLIPFILDLADELHEFGRCLANGIDINDFGFGLYTGTDPAQAPQNSNQQQQQQSTQQQTQQTSPRRARTSSFSNFWMPSKRHHPYNRIKTACCAKSGEEALAQTNEKSSGEAGAGAANPSSIGGTPSKTSASYSVVNKNGFQVSMNVKQFAPNELSVKTIDNCIVVEGRHDDKEDGHGVISRHFVRKYMLPKGYDPNDVLSTLSSDGILTVKAPPPPPPSSKTDESNERIIEIQATPGPTPVMVVATSSLSSSLSSAKDMPLKETTKKPLSAAARLECQLPEKRQKLDVASENETEEATTASIINTNSITNTCAATEDPNQESEDVEMEKLNEQQQITEKLEQQQKLDVVDSEIVVEKQAEILEQDKENEQKENEQETLNAVEESEQKLLDAKEDEKMDDKPEVTETPAEAETESANVNTAEENNEECKETKMEVDEETEKVTTNDNTDDADMEEQPDKETDNVNTKETNEEEITEKSGDKEDSEEKLQTPKEEKKPNNKEKETSISNETSAATTNTTTTNNSNNTSTNKSSSNTKTSKTSDAITTTTTTTTNNNSSSNSSSEANEKTEKDITEGNGVVTGELSDDKAKTNNKDTDAKIVAADSKAESNKTAESKAESDATVANEGETEDMETAELSTDTNTTTITTKAKTTTTTTIIDDVALLKAAAATADPTADIITADAEENVILTESIEGITPTTEEEEDLKNTTTTNSTSVDNMECSLFAKKTHLGNGNNTATATPIVGTEEMAN